MQPRRVSSEPQVANPIRPELGIYVPVEEDVVSLDGPRFHPESLNQWTHGFGFALSLVGAMLIVSTAVASGGLERIVGCSFYAATLVGLYLASTLSHSFSDPILRRRYRLVDQIAIFLLQIGCFAPIGLTQPFYPSGLILSAMTILALAGIAERVKSGPDIISVKYHLLIGWLPILALGVIFSLGNWAALGLVGFGALAYTGGAWFLVNDDRHPYLHAIWHLSTIVGSISHFLFLWLFVAA